MKKICLIIVLLTLFIPCSVNAKTIKDYRNDLASLKKKKADTEANQAEVQAKIDAATKKIQEITQETVEVVEEQNNTKEEIKKLENDIDIKGKQIKELMAFYQISNSDSFYLKYIFGADSFEDFIYRFSVIDQLTEKSDELIDEMNELIVKNEEKIVKLEEQEKELTVLQGKVKEEVAKLGTQKNEFMDTAIDIDQEIKSVQDKIDYYVEQGCGEDENLSTCLTSVPFDFGFIKPLKTGYINDEFGMRFHPTLYYWKMHNGIDIGGNREGTPVYAVAAGRVSDIIRKYYCGGNIVTVNHIVNGTYYTSRYWHLLDINVSVGDIVDQGDVIGTVGGGSGTYAWETCSTGAHLHFEMAKGHYYGTGENSYTSWSTYTSKVFSAREAIYFPAYGVRW